MFTRKRNIDKDKGYLVNEFLEKLIGKSRKHCRKMARKNDFIFLDSWGNKMGFVKETHKEYMILSLHFEDNKCHYYQVIVKKMNQKWLDSEMIDSDIVRQER